MKYHQGIPVAESRAEADQLFNSLTQSFFVTDFVEETPSNAPRQPGDIVYLASARSFSGGMPVELINKPLTVVACFQIECSDAEIWQLDLTNESGGEVPYLIHADEVATSKPF